MEHELKRSKSIQYCSILITQCIQNDYLNIKPGVEISRVYVGEEQQEEEEEKKKRVLNFVHKVMPKLLAFAVEI